MAYVDQTSGPDLALLVTRGLLEAGFERRHGDEYADSLGRTIHCSCGPETRWQGSWAAWAVFPIDYGAYEAYGAEVFVCLFRALCRSTTPVLARSFHPTGLDMMGENEIVGQVDYVDWIQHYSPRIVAAIGAERIRSAGFYHLEEFSDGAVLALAKSDYTGSYSNRKAIVEGLDLRPRRMMGRDPQTGEPMEIAWCR